MTRNEVFTELAKIPNNEFNRVIISIVQNYADSLVSPMDKFEAIRIALNNTVETTKLLKLYDRGIFSEGEFILSMRQLELLENR